MDSRLTSDLHINIKQSLFKKYLCAGSFFNYARSSAESHRIVMNDANLKKRYEDILGKLRRLLSDTALGDRGAGLIWSSEPSLLTCRGTVYHPNPREITPDMNPGRYKYINQTAWQIALRNQDYWMAGNMAEHMTIEERQKQFLEIFPDGVIRKYDWDLGHAEKLLANVFAAISQDFVIEHSDKLDCMSDSTRVTLEALYQYVQPALTQQVGLVFDANVYAQSLKIYKENNDKFEAVNQHTFWCVRVEEYLASLLGTGFLRRHVEGLDDSVRTHHPLSSYFPFRRGLNSIPGFHFFVGISGQEFTKVNSQSRHPLTAEYIFKLGHQLQRDAEGVMKLYAPLKISAEEEDTSSLENMREDRRPKKSGCLIS